MDVTRQRNSLIMNQPMAIYNFFTTSLLVRESLTICGISQPLSRSLNAFVTRKLLCFSLLHINC